MAYFAHQDVLDNGLAYIKNNCDKLVLLKNYTFGDNYATVTGSGNVLAEVSMTASDFTIATDGNDRKVTSASGKNDPSANASGTCSHFAFLDTSNSKVLWVTQETTGQSITSGNPVDFPSLVYTSKQPTL